MTRAAVPLLAALLLLAGGCAGPDAPTEKRDEVDDVAVALERYVHRYYETQLAEERHQPGPSTAARLKAREDLKSALRAAGIDLPEGNNLKAALDATRDLLVAHDYIFLPLSQADETSSDELGIAFAHVRRREAARSQELWGKKVEYKLIVFEPLVYDYPTWRARALHVAGPMYSPGRFSVARETIYIDHEFCVQRAQDQPPETQSLGLEGIEREVELRQAAYLLFGRAIKGPEELPKLHERVLWTAVRYGDPDLAWRDVNGLAADARLPAALREAAKAVKAKLPAALEGDKAARSAALRAAAEEAWKTLG